MRAFWSGEIAFGLVTIPAKLYTATKDLTPQFHQLHKECGTRITMVRRCPKCNRDLPWDEIGKGYEVAKGEYTLFTKEELAKLDGDDSAGTIEIVEFVNPLEVDLAYVEKSYWVGPGSKNVRGYQLLRSVLDDVKRVALAKVKIRTRTRLGLLRPRGRLFSLDMMRFAEELVPGDEIAPAEGKEASSREKELALHLIDERGPRRGRREGRSGRSRARHHRGGSAGRSCRGRRWRGAGDRPRGAPVSIDQKRRQAGSGQGRKHGGRCSRGKARKGQRRSEEEARDGLAILPDRHLPVSRSHSSTEEGISLNR
jgi:DNA end-binding protein Ku